MQAPDLVDALPSGSVVEVVGDLDGIEVVDVTHDSREVEPGWAFACIVGERADGHDHAASAVEQGAVLLLVERPLSVDVAQIVVGNVRAVVGHAAAAVHGRPSAALTVAGITGTNGKTTTAHMLGAILRADGREVRVLGTLSGARTTPEACDLQRRLAEFVRDGVDAVVMEVSSHAMVFDRVVGTEFDVVVFLNLGHDHLDLHRTQEAYFRAKASLFDPAFAPVGVTNLDDTSGRLLADAGPIEMVGFSRGDADEVAVEASGHSFVWRDQPVRVPIGGDVNVANSLAALTAAAVLGVDARVAALGLAALEPVPGRFEMVSDPSRHPFSVVVDYAVTPDALDEVMRSARGIVADGRVIAVFGAAGDRDPDKRAPMGEVGGRLADIAIVTSDNPRSEDPQSIVDQVVAGATPIDAGKVSGVVDRREAIALAIRTARPGDLIVIAGKGHESTQTIGDERRPFDDRVVARELLEEIVPTRGEPS